MKSSNLKSTPFLLIGLLVGIGVGAFISDAATLIGFPHHKYMLTIQHGGTEASTYLCAQRVSGAGLNLSSIDPETGKQKNCVMYVTGDKNLDGSFDLYYGTETWWGRWKGKDKPLHIPTKDILAVADL